MFMAGIKLSKTIKILGLTFQQPRFHTVQVEKKKSRRTTLKMKKSRKTIKKMRKQEERQHQQRPVQAHQKNKQENCKVVAYWFA